MLSVNKGEGITTIGAHIANTGWLGHSIWIYVRVRKFISDIYKSIGLPTIHSWSSDLGSTQNLKNIKFMAYLSS
jgi:hypothetical protein